MTEEIKSKAGRKGNAEAKDLQTCITKAEWEMRKFDATCCNDLKALYKLQRDMAFGTGTLGKACSPSNRKTAIDVMVARGEGYATGEAALLNKTGPSTPEEKPADEEQKQVSGGDVVVDNMSFEEKKKAFKLAQEAKKIKG